MTTRKKATALLLSATMSLSCAGTAFAAFEDLTDVNSHWAKNTLQQAYNDGILKGYDANTMAPNDSVTTAQAVAMLCRVLHVTGEGDTTAFPLEPNAWYAKDVAKGVYLGLLDETDAKELTKPITRGDAFCLFVRAFQLGTATYNANALSAFPDAAYLTGEAKEAAAILVDRKIVGGIDGKLDMDGKLTRAEFATILYRLVDRFTTAEQYTGGTNVGTVLSGDVAFSGLTAGNLWLDQSVTSVSLNNTSADKLVVRADALKDFSIQGNGRIQQLVWAARSGDLTLELPKEYSLHTLTIAEGTGSVAASGDIYDVEVVGDNRTVTLNSSVDTLTISGSGNTVTLKQGCTVDDIVITGERNEVKLTGKTDTLLLAGRENIISGYGRIDEVTLRTKYYKLNVTQNKLIKWDDFSIDDVTVSLAAPETLKAGAALEATANLTVPEKDQGKLCTASWYLNGKLMQETPVLLGTDTPVSSFHLDYTHDMQTNASLRFVLTYENSDRDAFTQEATTPINLEIFPDLGLADTTLKVVAPEAPLPAGQTLAVTAKVDSPEAGKLCKAILYVDGKQVASAPYTLGETPPTLSHTYDYYYGMKTTSELTYALTYTTEDGRKQEVKESKTISLQNFEDNGIAHATASLTAPSVLEAGKPLVATASFGYPEGGKACTAAWYVDGKKVSTQAIVLGKDTPKLTHTYTYTEKMKTTSVIKLVLSYTTADGRAQSISAEKNIQLKNYGYTYYHPVEDLAKQVTSTYAGNYTLAWAQKNDYSKDVKHAFVNYMGYSSSSNYLVWVNLTYQRVNIFTGSQGNWTLVREALCGAGKASTPTIKGVFTISYKQPSWNYGSYYCGPIVRFNGSSGYAFHSRLQYWPMNSDRYYDARIGFPISHGCLRMYNDDIWYMYNNLPSGTTVVVH